MENNARIMETLKAALEGIREKNSVSNDTVKQISDLVRSAQAEQAKEASRIARATQYCTAVENALSVASAYCGDTTYKVLRNDTLLSIIVHRYNDVKTALTMDFDFTVCDWMSPRDVLEALGFSWDDCEEAVKAAKTPATVLTDFRGRIWDQAQYERVAHKAVRTMMMNQSNDEIRRAFGIPFKKNTAYFTSMPVFEALGRKIYRALCEYQKSCNISLQGDTSRGTAMYDITSYTIATRSLVDAAKMDLANDASYPIDISHFDMMAIAAAWTRYDVHHGEFRDDVKFTFEGYWTPVEGYDKYEIELFAYDFARNVNSLTAQFSTHGVYDNDFMNRAIGVVGEPQSAAYIAELFASVDADPCSTGTTVDAE